MKGLYITTLVFVSCSFHAMDLDEKKYKKIFKESISITRTDESASTVDLSQIDESASTVDLSQILNSSSSLRLNRSCSADSLNSNDNAKFNIFAQAEYIEQLEGKVKHLKGLINLLQRDFVLYRKIMRVHLGEIEEKMVELEKKSKRRGRLRKKSSKIIIYQSNSGPEVISKDEKTTEEYKKMRAAFFSSAGSPDNKKKVKIRRASSSSKNKNKKS